MTPPHDVASTRLDNALLLFDEFVQAAVKTPDAAALRGLERRFAERLQIQPSYWSQIKGRSRQIGERLARQFEQLCRKPVGWMDLPHPAGGSGYGASNAAAGAGMASAAVSMPFGTVSTPFGAAPGPAEAAPSPSQPQDEDERFIIGLVLTYYRRHPQRARTRLLDLLGEVLTPVGADRAAPPSPSPVRGPPRGQPPLTDAGGVTTRATPPAPADDLSLWLRTQTGVAPLKRKP
jgi:hypothetical protein